MIKYGIIIPTRNRPELLNEAIQSVIDQYEPHWELIISDNDPHQSALSIYNNFSSDSRIKYFWTGGNSSMAQNFSFGILKSNAEYITVITDKTTLTPDCLTNCEKLLLKANYDIINWSEAHFFPENKDSIHLSSGFIRIVHGGGNIIEFNPVDEINYLLQFNNHRSHDMPHYFRGKILFGFVRKNLIIDLIENNKFFIPYAPDYTSRLLILDRVKNAVEICYPMQTAFISGESNGMLCSIYPDHAFRFFNESDGFQNVYKYFPIKGLFTSTQNHVAGDYLNAMQYAQKTYSINYYNLYGTVLFDLLKVRWPDRKLKSEQFKFLFNKISEYNLNFRLKFYLIKIPYILLLFLRNRINNIRLKLINKIQNKFIRNLFSYYEKPELYPNIRLVNKKLADDFNNIVKNTEYFNN